MRTLAAWSGVGATSTPNSVRYGFAGLTLAIGIGGLGHLLSGVMGVEGSVATFAVAAALLASLGLFLGRRVDALEQRTLEDPMTHVGNRRRWDTCVAEECERAVHSKMPLSLLLLDLDRLKNLNDAHGHACGDRALALVGEVLLETCRSRDVPARLGGDEFGVLLPRTRASEAHVVADRLRSGIARRSSQLQLPKGELLTVSIGIADIDGVLSPDPQDLFEAADEALYIAKAGGRNRIESQGPRTVSGIIELFGRTPATETRRGA